VICTKRLTKKPNVELINYLGWSDDGDDSGRLGSLLLLLDLFSFQSLLSFLHRINENKFCVLAAGFDVWATMVWLSDSIFQLFQGDLLFAPPRNSQFCVLGCELFSHNIFHSRKGAQTLGLSKKYYHSLLKVTTEPQYAT
jgi:hypothetical protein